MPIDYSFEVTPSFRDLTHTGLLVLKKPLVRSMNKLRRLRSGTIAAEAPAVVKTAKHFVGVR